MLNIILSTLAFLLILSAVVLVVAATVWSELAINHRRMNACIAGAELLAAVLFLFADNRLLASIVFACAGFHIGIVCGLMFVQRWENRAGR
ncbi:hypothetical protein ACFWGI_35600 [Streptomyces niveus]|uniref:hypothetical protein n=1 Tax=Streptomyces niveus TaxID=193462 RepID=UPI003668CAA7